MQNHLPSFVFLRLQIHQLPACQENSIEHNQHFNLQKLQLPVSSGNNFRQNACMCYFIHLDGIRYLTKLDSTFQ